MKAPLKILEDGFTAQLFRDDRKGDKGIVLQGTMESLEERLWQYNKRNYGIYYTVNNTGGRHRLEKNICGIRAYFCDVDGLSDDDAKFDFVSDALCLDYPPSALVLTKNGVHMLFYAAPGQSIDAERYQNTNMGLIQRFGGDKRVKDIARVLRLPPYLHVKDPANPYEVFVAYEDRDMLYTQEQIEKIYPYTPPKPKRPEANMALNLDNYDEAWGYVLRGLDTWDPVDGQKHTALMLALGVARKFGVPESEAVASLEPIYNKWPTKGSSTTLATNARWAYSASAQPATVAGLRNMGVPVEKIRMKRD